MPTAFVTGANSGIGHAFAQLLVSEGWEVYAADINVGKKIRDLGAHPVQLDVTSPESIAQASKTLAGRTLDVLLNVAGVMSPKDKDQFDTVDLETLQKTFQVNTFGPILLTQALLPNIFQSDDPKIGVVSSRVGSMADNSSGGGYAYRSSKAAVNSLFKNLSVDLREVKVPVHILHPGIVKTSIDTEGTTHGAKDAIEPGEAASKLWKLFNSISLEGTGKFWHREGQELPW